MKLFFVSLGCDKTLADSEHIIGFLTVNGYEITDDVSIADVIAVNTCCFINDALEESINTVLELYNQKKDNAKLIVFGCMAKRFFKDIKETLPEAEILIESADKDEIINNFKKILFIKDDTDYTRYPTGLNFYSYLKIADGCNKHCTYCVIPSIKGHFSSIPMETLVEEATLLAKNGTKELILVAQETTLYGTDLYGKKSLHTLISRLSEIPSIEWIRILYAYPEEIYDELIFEMRDNPKVCHYIDMPIQHCNDEILKRMGRKTSKCDIIQIIKRLRSEIPNICIRTTLISGFPGETEQQHQELSNFISDYKFDRLGVFPYSREENTVAYNLDGQIDEEIKIQRADSLMEEQQKTIFKKAKDCIGTVQKCIIEGFLAEDGVWQGRSFRDAPDIDGLVFFKSPIDFISGDFADIKITETSGYDLVGELYESR